MNPSEEKGAPRYDYVSGFGSLANFMASDTDHSPLIYRRFDKLAIRDLIYYQSQLSQLQAEQDEFDIHDRIIVDSTGDSGEEHRDMIRDCAQDWNTFQHAAIGLPYTLPAQGSATDSLSHANQRWEKRMDLAMRIRTTLKDYREALIQQSTLLSMPAPSTQTMKAMSRYFHGSIRSTPAGIVNGSAAYSILSGASSSLYPLNMSESQIRASDYVSLSKPTEPDVLTNLLRTRLPRIFRTKPPPLLPLHHAGRPQPTISHLSPAQMKYYSYERVRLTASFITTLAAAILLFVPIYTLYNTSKSQPSLTLALIAMFTVIFAGSLAVMTTASRSEIFGACAAYSAVLVVFISGDFASGGGGG
ncbi:hypothetical protein J7T55_000597 [Diaporthe amygdali]|uniref:uncharacterized protein n=1 Tax=Phomopsis amygdali TaxID=1214568 RepID=UPI0022FE4931|nr:uncharacterized protein J7T55_000597 [Diaporthe amygdali]KAJ0110165.1 hypothetical protein J7T55_000597 [Diaporthe amygdali]